jgi:hypothetical protein
MEKGQCRFDQKGLKKSITSFPKTQFIMVHEIYSVKEFLKALGYSKIHSSNAKKNPRDEKFSFPPLGWAMDASPIPPALRP